MSFSSWSLGQTIHWKCRKGGILYLSVFGPVPTNFGPDCVPGISGDLELAGRAHKRPGQVLYICARVHFLQELLHPYTVD